MGQKTLKTVAIYTGSWFTRKNCVAASSQFALSPFSWPQCSYLFLQVPHTVSLKVFSDKASVERRQWPAQTHSMGWLWGIASAGKHCTPQVCCHGEQKTALCEILLCFIWLLLCQKGGSICKCEREQMARWDHFKRDHLYFPCFNYRCELSFT